MINMWQNPPKPRIIRSEQYYICQHNQQIRNFANKFFIIKITDNSIHINRGRIGTCGKKSVMKCINRYEIDRILTKRISKLISKGYRLVSKEYYQDQIHIANLIGKTNTLTRTSWAKISIYDKSINSKKYGTKIIGEFKFIDESELSNGEIGMVLWIFRPNADNLIFMTCYDIVYCLRYSVEGQSRRNPERHLIFNSSPLQFYEIGYYGCPIKSTYAEKIDKAVGYIIKHAY